MSNGVIVIFPDGKISKIKDNSLNHITSLRLFIKENDLGFPGYEKFNQDYLSLYLTGLSFIVVLIDKFVNNIYIGEKVSNKQRDWYSTSKKRFKDNILKIKSIDDSIVNTYNLEDEGKEDFLSNIFSNKPILDRNISKKKVVK